MNKFKITETPNRNELVSVLLEIRPEPIELLNIIADYIVFIDVIVVDINNVEKRGFERINRYKYALIEIEM
jgi:hypothetical protein